MTLNHKSSDRLTPVNVYRKCTYMVTIADIHGKIRQLIKIWIESIEKINKMEVNIKEWKAMIISNRTQYIEK